MQDAQQCWSLYSHVGTTSSLTKGGLLGGECSAKDSSKQVYEVSSAASQLAAVAVDFRFSSMAKGCKGY